jgi:hypothetical protein
LFGSVVLDENGFGTSPQREELRVLGATLDPSIDRDFEFRAKARRSVDPPDRSGHSSMQGKQRRRLGPGEIKSCIQPKISSAGPRRFGVLQPTVKRPAHPAIRDDRTVNWP